MSATATAQPRTMKPMVHDVERTEGENGVLRWGGLAGILGAVLFIIVFVFVGVVVGADPAGPAGPVSRFPDIQAARSVENSLYLVVLTLWAVHFMALYRALRETSLAPALFGSGLGILGLGVLAAGALPHIATSRISDLYHAPGASPEGQATLALTWQATQGIFDALLFTGLFILPIGLIALGVAMFAAPTFGKRLGWTSLGLGAVGLAAATVVLVDPASLVAAIGVFALIAFHLVVGWKVYRLSRA